MSTDKQTRVPPLDKADITDDTARLATGEVPPLVVATVVFLPSVGVCVTPAEALANAAESKN